MYVDRFSLPVSEEAPSCRLARGLATTGQMVSGLLQAARTGLVSSCCVSAVQRAVMAMAGDWVGSAVFGHVLQPCRRLVDVQFATVPVCACVPG